MRIGVFSILVIVLLNIASCGRWRKAEAVIALADSIDQNHHVIYDDTVALRNVIHTLNNPLGRTFKRSTLGKAFYYMGRNLEDDYSQVARAAECYVAADWLKIDDPIYRGRVNTCMAGICEVDMPTIIRLRQRHLNWILISKTIRQYLHGLVFNF